jgi:ribonuclease HI
VLLVLRATNTTHHFLPRVDSHYVSSFLVYIEKTNGFSGAKFKSFHDKQQAEDYLRAHGQTSASPPSNADVRIITAFRSGPRSPVASPATVSCEKAIEHIRSAHAARPNPDVRIVTAFTSRPCKRDSPEFVSAARPRKYAKTGHSVGSELDNSENAKAETRHRSLCPVGSRRLKIHINFDGGSRGNPGVAGAGVAVVLTDLDWRIGDGLYERLDVHLRFFVGTGATNNEAEYSGALWALTVAREETLRFESFYDCEAHVQLVVQGDSKLIIQQLKGNYTCKSPKLKPYYEKAIQLLDDFQSFAQFRLSLEHVYRESNKQADGLANEAMDAQRSWLTTSLDGHEMQHALSDRYRVCSHLK